jgi:curved DNA-binding protein CbpA
LNRSQCYKLLGLNEGASINQIKYAYRKLALEYHPDKNISAKDGEKFKMISEAYHTLREKNNSHIRIDHRTEYHTKKQQYMKKGFPVWLNLFYTEMNYTCTRYAKNVYSNYLKYEPIFLRYHHKIKKNAFIMMYSIIQFFLHNRIKNAFRIITKSTSNLEKTITKTIRW